MAFFPSSFVSILRTLSIIISSVYNPNFSCSKNLFFLKFSSHIQILIQLFCKLFLLCFPTNPIICCLISFFCCTKFWTSSLLLKTFFSFSLLFLYFSFFCRFHSETSLIQLFIFPLYPGNFWFQVFNFVHKYFDNGLPINVKQFVSFSHCEFLTIAFVSLFTSLFSFWYWIISHTIE